MTELQILRSVTEARIVTPYMLAQRAQMHLSTVLRGLSGEHDMSVSRVTELYEALLAILAEDTFRRAQYERLMGTDR